MDIVYRGNYNNPASPFVQPLLERSQDEIDRTRKTADAILAAGYSKPRTITTEAELDALPSGSVILDSSGEPNVLHDNGWVLPGGGGGYTTWAVAQNLPAMVLYEP